MAQRSLVRRFPFTCYGVAATIGILVIVITNPDYDGRTIGAFFKLTQAIWAFPFFLCKEIGLPFFLGFVPCFFADWLLARFRRSRNADGKDAE